MKTLICSFIFFTLIFSVPSLAATNIYQNRSIDKDSNIDEYYPNSFEPWDTSIMVATGNDYPADIRGLLEFDLNNSLSGYTIVNASLALYSISFGGSPTGRTYIVYPMWTNKTWIDGQDTWNSNSTGKLWTNPGGDYNSTPSASATVPGLATWMTWDVTQIVKDFVNTSNNFSVVIKDSVEGQPRAETRFVSTETTMWAGYEPRLTINVISVPIILTPDNNTRHFNNSMNITWTTNASSYHYQFSNQTDFSSITYESNVSTNFSGSVSTTDGVTYYIRVRSNESNTFTEWSRIINITENSLPSILDNDFLRPPSPTALTNLTISLNISADADGDMIVNHTMWYKNGILNTSWNDSLFLNYSNFTGGDSVYVKAYLSDGYENTTVYTSNQVIISSSNSAPTISSISLNPTTRKYNKQVWINSSSITDSESSYVRLLTYYKVAETNVYLNNSTWYAPPITINLTFNNPWSDGAAHTIYGMVEDSGNVTGVNNLTSGEVQATLTSDIMPPSVSTSSLSVTSIYTGTHVTINLNTSIANGVVSNVSVHVSRPDATEADYAMNTTDNTTWTFKYTATSDIGSYYIESFSMQDDSNNRGIETSALTFIASTAPTGSTGGGGGGGGSSTIIVVKSDNGTLTLVNVTSTENLKDLLKLGECFSSNILMSNTCAQSSITLVDSPLNWWVLFGSYIGSLTVLFILALRNDEKKRFAENILFYGTISWVTIILLNFSGLNLYIFNYAFNSPLPGFMFLSFFGWGAITTMVGDSYSKRKLK